MASVWIRRRGRRWRVEYRAGGRGTPIRYLGTFSTQREALARKAWAAGELAAHARRAREPGRHRRPRGGSATCP